MALSSTLAIFALSLMNSLGDCESYIETIPNFRNNVITTGYTGLTLSANFESSGNECRWNLKNMHSVVIFSPDQPCANRSENSDISTCVETATSDGRQIQTTFIISEPITSTLVVTIGCVDGYRTESLEINVQGQFISLAVALLSFKI